MMKNSEISNTSENLEKLMQEELDLFKRKNKDYGNSFEQSLDEDGLLVAKIRLGDKMRRFSTLIKNTEREVNDESLRDTLMDLSIYANMTVLWLEKMNKKKSD